MREVSPHAACAKAIRKELKEAYPDVKFSITSESFAGGNSVDVKWTGGPKRSEVSELIDKYQEGNVNGYTDCYEYSNRRDDIPQVMFVCASRELTEEEYEGLKYWREN